MMLGTIINIITVIAGTAVGVVFRSKMPQKIIQTVFKSLGLFTIFFGFSMALKSEEYLVMIFSLAIGAIIGEGIDLEKYLDNFSESIKKRTKQTGTKFNEGLITAFLLFCTGPMTILGAIEDGLGNPPNLLYMKSVLDGFASVALAAALGIGVGFSIIPLFIYQGGLTLLAVFLGNFLPEIIIMQITAIGGILLIGMAINMLEIGKVKVVNMLPALVLMPLISYVVDLKLF